MSADELKKQVNDLIGRGCYDKIKPLLLSDKDTTEHDNELAMTCYLCTIYEQEKMAGQRTIFDKVSDLEALLERYTRLKFYLRRIDFDVMDGGMEDFYQFLLGNQVSSYELLRVAEYCAVHKEKVLRAIKGETEEQNQQACREREAFSPQTAGRMAGEREICFIICTNDRLYAEECLYYINHLRIPEGFAIDVLTVEEAKSMTAGYNEAMRCSGAKYKVYLHQDTFIVNPWFIEDFLRIFGKYPEIGLLGNVGVRHMPASGIMWDADRYGMLYEQHIYETELLINRIEKITDRDYLEVDAVDGFIMITQYDIPWREDIFDQWDFYDCSQSMEFIRHGYKTAVPRMAEPWCVHDCGFINLSRYEGEREKFVREYL